MSVINITKTIYTDYVAGDILMYNIATDTKFVIPVSELSAEKYPLDSYTPIGVIVVPSSHDVYGTGQAGVMSLKAMNLTTPKTGGISESGVCWGANYVDTSLTNLNTVITTDNTESATLSSGIYGYLPSSNFASSSGATSVVDETIKYSSSAQSDALIPSPYLSDGSRNPQYYDDTTTATNALADFDGVGNTAVLTALATAQSGWSTEGTAITNSYARGYYPPACACYMFDPTGVEGRKGEWYLPACGELGYIMSRFNEINTAIATINSIYGDSVGVELGSNNGYWSSSEYNSTNARYVYMGDGSVDYLNKYNRYYVRAFTRI